jgi:hypothetical protein
LKTKSQTTHEREGNEKDKEKELEIEESYEFGKQEEMLEERKSDPSQEVDENYVVIDLEEEIEREIMLFEKLITDLETQDNELNSILRSRRETQIINQITSENERDKEKELEIEESYKFQIHEEKEFIELQNQNDNELIQVVNLKGNTFKESILVKEVIQVKEDEENDKLLHHMLKKVEYVEIF